MERKLQQLCIALALTFSMMACNSSENQDALVKQPVTDDNNPPTPGDNERKDIQLNMTETQVVGKNNDFAFQLFRQINGIETMGSQSHLVSPLSITYALGMLNNGAAGETQQQINKVLGFEETQASGINEFAKKMISELPTLDKLTRVALANNIYVNKDYQLKTSFVEKAKQYFNAQPETRDFADGKTLEAINRWGYDNTQQMIERVLSPNEFEPSAVSYLLNATYFKGAWAAKFDKAETSSESFNGSEKKVAMMHQNNTFNYYENETCQALRLPFGNSAYAMTVLLPREGKSVSQVAGTLDATSWKTFQWMPGQAIVDVKLPCFETQTEVSLNQVLSALGMPNAFNVALADFSNFCNVQTYIEMMKQVSKIKLDEEGTEAAAITVIASYTSTGGSDVTEPRRVNFHANRPFLYVISEQSTGAILFIGQYCGD